MVQKGNQEIKAQDHLLSLSSSATVLVVDDDLEMCELVEAGSKSATTWQRGR
jgi:hypothetical protein